MKTFGWLAVPLLARTGCATPLPSLEGRAEVEEISAASVEDGEDLVLEVNDGVVYRFDTALGAIDTDQVVIPALGQDHPLSEWLLDAGLAVEDLDGMRIGTVDGLASVDETARKREECCVCEQTPPASDVMSCVCEMCAGG